MRFVFVMDALARVSPVTDTTYGFIAAALPRGHECLHCLPTEVELHDGAIKARVRPLGIGAEGAPLEAIGELWRQGLADVDAVFIRKDPPFDQAYFYATLLLEQLRPRTLLLNDPRGLREANEKLYILNFPRWIPPTLVTSDRDAIHAFVAEVGGEAVIKPLDGAGGFGVMALTTGEKNARAIVDMLTREGGRLAMVQQYLPAIVQGDKRVLLLDGEPLGAILRVPRGGDLRANIHVGSEVRAAELDDQERALVADIAPRLRRDGLAFVGLDLIGGRLTEINVTSPTGIRELGRLTQSQPSGLVIDWVEQRVRSRGSS